MFHVCSVLFSRTRKSKFLKLYFKLNAVPQLIYDSCVMSEGCPWIPSEKPCRVARRPGREGGRGASNRVSSMTREIGRRRSSRWIMVRILEEVRFSFEVESLIGDGKRILVLCFQIGSSSEQLLTIGAIEINYDHDCSQSGRGSQYWSDIRGCFILNRHQFHFGFSQRVVLAVPGVPFNPVRKRFVGTSKVQTIEVVLMTAVVPPGSVIFFCAAFSLHEIVIDVLRAKFHVIVNTHAVS